MSWQDEYKRKCVSVEDAVAAIRSGDRVSIHPGVQEPGLLVEALIARGPELRDVEIIHVLTFGEADYVEPQYEGHFRHVAFFIGSNVRKAVNEGRADFIPIFLGEVPELFKSGAMPIDVSLINVSRPDEHGFCSFGADVGVGKAATWAAKTVIAQVNDEVPRTHGDAFIHVKRLDYIVEASAPLHELKSGVITEVHQSIGRHIADLIPDGATLQMGIGAIPDAVLPFLQEKKDLGVHTEMFSDGLVELVQSGVVTGEKKSIHPGKIVAGFFMGTKTLYDWADNNPFLEMHPTEYVNDPYIISQNDRMVAINSALQIDLTGQVCSDSIGPRLYSGFGGQLDFIRGAARSKEGVPIIALPSTAKGGEVSRIVPMLDRGAGVVTTRGDVHWIVTEFGAAYLHGKTVRERAEALISIAHPDFRDELTEFACEQNYLDDRRHPAGANG
jgi:4-hydroxybutyrate CoA-transferase